MKRLFTLFAILFFGFALAVPASAAEFATKDEAVAFVKKAVAYAKEVGIEKAAAEFSAKDGKWQDRDLYLIVADIKGIRVAHGLNAKLIGKSLADSVDVTGKAYGKEFMDGAATKGSGWVEYMFVDPISKKQLPKEGYYEKSGDYVFLAGVYKR